MLTFKRRQFGQLALATLGGIPLINAPWLASIARADELIEAARDGIARTLADFAEAQLTGDDAKLRQTIDPQAPWLYHVIAEQHRQWRRGDEGGLDDEIEYTVNQARTAPGDFIKASVTVSFEPSGDGGDETHVFRRVGDRWLLSEPTEAELGVKLERETPRLRVSYYTWDQATIGDVTATLDRAARDDLALSAEPLPGLILTTLHPTYQNPNVPPRFSGWFDGAAIHLRSPESYGFGQYRPGDRDTELAATMRHEYGHALYHQRLVNASLNHAPARPWLNEGFAEWLSWVGEKPLLKYRLISRRVPPKLIDWADDRLFPEYTGDTRDISLAYAIAAAAVTYIVQDRGGLATYWRFNETVLRRRSQEAGAQAVFGSSWADFQREFRAWLEA